MNNEQKTTIISYIDSGLFLIWGIFFIFFPLFFLTATTDAFFLPKELLLAGLVLVSLLAFAVKTLMEGAVRISRTPLDVPVLLFAASLILSAIFSPSHVDSLLIVTALLFAAVAYFVLTNVMKRKTAGFFLGSCLTAGIVLTTVITVLSYFKLYLLPFSFSHTAAFTPLGTYLDFVLYAVILLPFSLYFLLPAMKKQLDSRVGVFALTALTIIGGILFIGHLLVTTNKPPLLPFDTGFQTAFAAISQDSGRILQGFFFGTGYGTFASSYTRFHNAAINSNNALWYVYFINSSSYILELLTTAGLVGVLSFLFLFVRTLLPIAKKSTNPMYLSLLIFLALSFFLPLTLTELLLLFFLMGIFALFQKHNSPEEYFDVELRFVALKKGVLAFTTLEEMSQPKRDKHATPIVAFIVVVALIIIAGYYTTTFFVSNILFQSSLAAAGTNNGTLTYRLETQAIQTFPYVSDYYRVFSQTNIQLANSLLALNTGKSSPSAQTQQTALQLIQQAITTSKQATTLSPESVVEWQNLASVYRTLLGVGQNADSFAVAATQQAILLDPNNPQEYLSLGGLYYQLGQFDNAIPMFQRAIALKQDYANAYYNLGHTYESKNDLQNALAQYQIVQELMANDPANLKKITDEINALKAKTGSAQTPSGSQKTVEPTTQQEPLHVNGDSTTLPGQPTQVPLASPTPSK